MVGDGARTRAQRGDRPEVDTVAVGQPGARADHVVHHVAVGNRARAAGIVAGHAAERGLCAGGDVHRKPQAVRLQLGIQVIEYQPGFDLRRALRHIDVEHLSKMLGGVDHQGRAGGLAALAGASAARQDRHLQVARDVDGEGDVALAAGHEHADWRDLIDGCIRGIAAARSRVEQHFAFGLGAQPAHQRHADIVGRRHGAGGP